MASIYDVQPNLLIGKVAEELKKNSSIKEPAWVNFVKTGAHKERPPVRRDWWFTRAAAILRKVAVLGPIGVSKLRRLYGGKKNMGSAPERVYKGSGSIVRKVLQQLDKAGFTKQVKIGVHMGRSVTPEGVRFLDKCAAHLTGEEAKPANAKKTSGEK